MKKTLIACATIGALFAGSASAADIAMKAPMMKAPPPVYSWTGCYLSAGAGYGMWTDDHNTTAAFGGTLNALTTTNTGGGNGWLGRLGGGCDYQLGGGLSNFVIGVFGDYDWMNLKGTMVPDTVFGGFPVQADQNEKYAWSVGGRIGYTITPTVLTYIDAGYTQTHFDQMSTYTNTGVLTGLAYPSHTYTGWFLGSGFEYNFNWLPIPGLFLRSEYRFSSYSRDDLTQFAIATGLPVGNGGTGDVLHSRPWVQTVTTSLVWRFNWGGPVVAKY
jgi:outer membrane immunogenic protein